jgi:hypothetical protein
MHLSIVHKPSAIFKITELERVDEAPAVAEQSLFYQTQVVFTQPTQSNVLLGVTLSGNNMMACPNNCGEQYKARSLKRHYNACILKKK